MPLKAVLAANILATIMISGPLGTQGDTSIVELSEQSVKWYKKIITQLADN